MHSTTLSVLIAVSSLQLLEQLYHYAWRLARPANAHGKTGFEARENDGGTRGPSLLAQARRLMGSSTLGRSRATSWIGCYRARMPPALGRRRRPTEPGSPSTSFWPVLPVGPRVRCRIGRQCTWRCMPCTTTSLRPFATICDHLRPFRLHGAPRAGARTPPVEWHPRASRYAASRLACAQHSILEQKFKENIGRADRSTCNTIAE